MFLAIDVGNTTVALGCFADRKLKRAWKIKTHPVRTADQYRTELHTLLGMDGISLRDVSAAAISSVVPEATAAIREAIGGADARVIDSTWPFSFTNATREPARVGVDRLVNLEAAVQEHGSPVIVIDSGTATTLSVVESGAKFTGGAIFPGMSLLSESLGARAAQLFPVELSPPERAIGNDTREALQSGVVFGYAGMVDGLLERVQAEIGESVPILVTGGNGELLKKVSKRLTGARVDSQLTLRGIEYAYERKIRT